MKISHKSKQERDYKKIPQLMTVGMVSEITHLRKQIDDALSHSPTLPHKDETSSPRLIDRYYENRRTSIHLNSQVSRESIQHRRDRSRQIFHCNASSRNSLNKSVAEIPYSDIKEFPCDTRKYRCASNKSPPRDSLIGSVNFLKEPYVKILEDNDRTKEIARKNLDNGRIYNSILLQSSSNTPKVITNAITHHSYQTNPFFQRKKVIKIQRKLQITEMFTTFEQSRPRIHKSLNLSRSNRFSC